MTLEIPVGDDDLEPKPDTDPQRSGIPYQSASSLDSGFPMRGSYDMLRTIFEGQTLLMQKYADQERRNGEPMPEMDDWGSLDSRTVQMRLHSLYGFIVREMSEAMAHLDAKPWKDNPRPVNEDKFYEELGDTLHFFVEFCLVSGLGSKGLFDQYFRAWEKNRDRQASGY